MYAECEKMGIKQCVGEVWVRECKMKRAGRSQEAGRTTGSWLEKTSLALLN